MLNAPLRRSRGGGVHGRGGHVGGGGGAEAEEDDFDGVEEHPEVEPEREMLDVIQVVPHLLGLFLQVVGVAVAHLGPPRDAGTDGGAQDRKSTRLNSSHSQISYAVFCLKKKNKKNK